MLTLYDDLSMSKLIELAKARAKALQEEAKREREGSFEVHPELIDDAMLIEQLVSRLKRWRD